MKTIEGKVTVGITDLNGQAKEFVKPVFYPEYETADDVLTALAGASKEVVEDLLGSLNYGTNLKARAKVTAQIKAENQGPEISINRLLAQMEKNHEKLGKKFDKEESRKFILSNMEMFGINAN